MPLTPKQCATKLNVSLSIVYGLLTEGRLPCMRIGLKGRRGKILIEEADVEAFKAACKLSAAPPSPAKPKVNPAPKTAFKHIHLS